MSTLKDMAYAVWCVPKGAFDRAKIIFYSAKFRIYQRAGILKRLSDAGFHTIEPYQEKEWALFPVFKIYYTAWKDENVRFVQSTIYRKTVCS